ncbi:DUF397 domain-containing protein [Kitasatospora purpeofusca]|uniref:DUF397 domain-containing protein n=1 Tax=Kitasatospora purpeofusca TaxID=67352 RepID=UPI000B184FCA|nr:DUF397 domain-containing protein [Kitasatospora purpeofusca]MCX4752145.1 DUF397 domain-containing protein [Kitasatospora purpeofusca]WSR31741.1 DUF397 domain-containing protein [Kitasatospora purpeofusca]WSR39765.1 DUF397 domain-containing protein [Kitasatospora purpeofusca]
MTTDQAWRKSSYSGSEGGNCIEVADTCADTVPVRDSKDPHGPTLTFSTDAWQSFITAVHSGELPTQP